MNIKDYQEFASKGLREESLHKNNVLNFALGLAGESGEVCDLIKKREFHNRYNECPVERVEEELGDVMWYVANLCTELGLDLETVLQKNELKLKRRYEKLYKGEE